MPTFFLCGPLTLLPIHTLYLGPSWLFATSAKIELHGWGCSILFCTPANDR